MCGLAGYINFVDKKINIKKVSEIMNSIKHRGPDHKNFWLSEDKNTALVNTRLAIQDLSKNGNQPFISHDKRYILVFNGEIYNFKILKNKLKEYKFTSNSDTEVLLYLFIKYGEGCLKMLDGMFSFAIYDRKKAELFCARDHFGIKPFYYFYEKNQFWFSSELKTFFKLDINIKKNEKSIYRYLSGEYYEHINETFYKNIFKLKPGHYIKVNKSNKKEIKYWDFLESYKSIILPKNDFDRENFIFELINQSVTKSMISDVPVSIAASGGLDSSILQNIVKKKNPKIDLISFVFKNKTFSEEKYIKQISKISGLKSKIFYVTPEIFIRNINKIVTALEEPFAGLPIAAYFFCVEKLAKTKVVLDGSGLDEAHCGYDKYNLLKSDKNKNLVTSQDGSKSILNNIINQKFKKKFRNFNTFIDRPFEDNYKNLMFADLFYIKLPRALRFRDKLGMYNGKEIRPCFLDKNLIATLFKLKFEDHYRKGLGKFFLRKTFQNEITKKIAYAKKRNIQTPQIEWFRKNIVKWLEDFFKRADIWDTGWVDRNQFLKNFELLKKNKLNNSYFIWQLVNLEAWNKLN